MTENTGPEGDQIPEGFVCEVLHAEDALTERLSLQEAAILSSIKNAGHAARFKLGRLAAHRCLTHFHESKPSVLRGDGGEPLFPNGYVGSISHTDNTAAAVVGSSAHYLSLGIDLESTTRALNRSIIDRIGTAQEKKWVKESPQKRALMVFCAKESVYKALFPLHRKKMGFLDVATHWEEEHGAFISTLLTDFGAPWEAGATMLTLCQEAQGFIMAVTVIEQMTE